MSVIIHRSSTEGFSMLPNSLLRQPDMSARARGVLVTLLSHEDGWQQSATYTEREMTDGRYAIRAAIKELTDLGYVVRERRPRSGGKWQTDIHVYDTPKPAVSPQSGTPTSVAPTVGQTALSTKNPEDVKALDVEPQDQELQPPAANAAVPGHFDAGKWHHLLDKLHSQGFTEQGRGALTWKFLMDMRNKYTAPVVDSALSDATLGGGVPLGSSAAYFESICVRFQEAQSA